MKKDSLYYLNTYFKHPSFKTPQESIINTVLSNQDCIALLPTGGGKSVCYQIPALVKEGLCLVISPLIALMRDQVNQLTNKGIKAVFLQPKTSQTDLVRIFDNCKYGQIKFLFLSPERLQSDFIIDKIKELNLNLIAVDEAHCISEWGHDFRPAYLKIGQLKTFFQDIPFLALTATATPIVLTDIETYLFLDKPKLFKKSFYRENISYQIIETEDKNNQLLTVLKKSNKPSIIYVKTRRLTKTIAEFLNYNQVKASFYHGGLNLAEKEKAYYDWMSEKTPIIVATNAFGMGIDKANVHTVIHYNTPSSIENYAQETGRAGRNGLVAKAILLKDKSDINNLTGLFKKSTPSVNFIKQIYQLLNQFYGIAYGELQLDWFLFDLSNFCKTYKLDVLLTYNSLKILERETVLSLSNSYYEQCDVKFIASNNQVLHYAQAHKKLGLLIKTILRTYGGLFENKSAINTGLIASKLNTTKREVLTTLKLIAQDKIIELKANDKTVQLHFLVPREDEFTINKISNNIKRFQKHQLNKLKAVINFVNQNEICRAKLLLKYFGETLQKNCGVCDVCQTHQNTHKKVNYNKIANQILILLKQQKSIDSKTIIQQLNTPAKYVLTALRLLLDNNKIIVNSQHQYQLKNKS